MKRLLLLFALIAQPLFASEPCTVTRIIDGDTFVAIISGIPNETYRVRLADIDAPEKKQDYGLSSMSQLSAIMLNKDITLDIQGKDMYGRTLAIVYADGENVGYRMVKDGAAWVYPKNKDKSYWEAMESAKQHKRGLWQNPNPMSPRDYRKSH